MTQLNYQTLPSMLFRQGQTDPVDIPLILR